MRLDGWVFMIASVSSVFLLVVYCVGKVLFYAPKD